MRWVWGSKATVRIQRNCRGCLQLPWLLVPCTVRGASPSTGAPPTQEQELQERQDEEDPEEEELQRGGRRCISTCVSRASRQADPHLWRQPTTEQHYAVPTLPASAMKPMPQ